MAINNMDAAFSDAVTLHDVTRSSGNPFTGPRRQGGFRDWASSQVHKNEVGYCLSSLWKPFSHTLMANAVWSHIPPPFCLQHYHFPRSLYLCTLNIDVLGTSGMLISLYQTVNATTKKVVT
jgi:hypothetical protein